MPAAWNDTKFKHSGEIKRDIQYSWQRHYDCPFLFSQSSLLSFVISGLLAEFSVVNRKVCSWSIDGVVVDTSTAWHVFDGQSILGLASSARYENDEKPFMVLLVLGFFPLLMAFYNRDERSRSRQSTMPLRNDSWSHDIRSLYCMFVKPLCITNCSSHDHLYSHMHLLTPAARNHETSSIIMRDTHDAHLSQSKEDIFTRVNRLIQIVVKSFIDYKFVSNTHAQGR